MNIKALFFGMSRDLAGQSPITLELDNGITVKGFRELLVKKYHQKKFSKGEKLALNSDALNFT